MLRVRIVSLLGVFLFLSVASSTQAQRGRVIYRPPAPRPPIIYQPRTTAPLTVPHGSALFPYEAAPKFGSTFDRETLQRLTDLYKPRSEAESQELIKRALSARSYKQSEVKLDFGLLGDLSSVESQLRLKSSEPQIADALDAALHRPVQATVLSLLPLSEAAYRSTFPDRPYTKVSASDVSKAHEFSKLPARQVSVVGNADQGRKDVEISIQAFKGANTLVVVGHAIGKGEEQKVVLPNGDAISVREIADLSTKNGLSPIFVTCNSKTFGTGEIGVTTALQACNAAFAEAARDGKTSQVEFADAIRTKIVSEGYRTKLTVATVGGTLVIIILMAAMDDEDEDGQLSPGSLLFKSVLPSVKMPGLNATPYAPARQ